MRQRREGRFVRRPYRHRGADRRCAGAIEGNANTGERFRFDPTLGTSGGYLYNLSTVGLAAGHHTLVVGVSGDPMEHAIGFDIR